MMGLRVISNRLDYFCKNSGKSYAADKPNASFMDVTIHELATL